MFRFVRTATVRYGASYPAALKFAGEVTAYVNKHYEMGMRCGVEMYGAPRIHWHFDIDSLDRMQQFNAKLMADRDYFGLLDKYKETWVDGSLQDMLVALQP
ncbi:hypothetical protein [Aquabacterium sp.]|uniref:hypothetical protein n=1 Tax=Aquabacterium sp. TaxID=1872578 RepID=UPI0037848D07